MLFLRPRVPKLNPFAPFPSPETQFISSPSESRNSIHFLRFRVPKLNSFPPLPSPESQFISSAASPDVFGENRRPAPGHARGFPPVPSLYVRDYIPPIEQGSEASDNAA